MKRRAKLTAEEQVEILRRYEGGERTADIAAVFDVTLNVVANTVRRLGGKVRPLGTPWRGESFITEQGYRMLSVRPGDPIADGMVYENGHILEHRLIMARHLGRALREGETVHHINGDRADNRLENLQLRVGAHGRGVAMQCADCGSHNVVHTALAAGDD